MGLTAREQFLLDFYNNVWLNVRRAETSLWILFPIYFTTIIGLLYSRDQIGIFLMLFFLSILSIVFSAIAFNLNSWFVRNMRLVSKSEGEFLQESDYDRIIPEKWANLKIGFINKEPYCITGIGYLLVGLTITIYLIAYSNYSLSKEQIVLLLLVWGSLLICEFFYVNSLRKAYNLFIKETP